MIIGEREATSGGRCVELQSQNHVWREQLWVPNQSSYWDFVCGSSTQKSPDFHMIGTLCESNVFYSFHRRPLGFESGLCCGIWCMLQESRSLLLLIWKMNHHPSPSALVDFSIFPAWTFCIHPLFISMSFPVTLTDKISPKRDATPTTIYHSQNSLNWPNKLHLIMNLPWLSAPTSRHIRYFWYDIK